MIAAMLASAQSTKNAREEEGSMVGVRAEGWGMRVSRGLALGDEGV